MKAKITIALTGGSGYFGSLQSLLGFGQYVTLPRGIIEQRDPQHRGFGRSLVRGKFFKECQFIIGQPHADLIRSFLSHPHFVSREPKA